MQNLGGQTKSIMVFSEVAYFRCFGRAKNGVGQNKVCSQHGNACLVGYLCVFFSRVLHGFGLMLLILVFRYSFYINLKYTNQGPVSRKSRKLSGPKSHL